MTVFRKILALFVVLFMAMPALFSSIWSVGAMRMVLQPRFLSEIPQETIKDIPSLVDATFTALKVPGVVKDPKARQWIEAMAKVKTTPAQILKQTGVFDWLSDELAGALKQFGQMLQGEIEPRSIVLDNKKLKAALSGPAFQRYLQEVLAQLPACQEPQKQQWRRVMLAQEEPKSGPPACNPGGQVTQAMVNRMLQSVLKIPPTFALLEQDVPLAIYLIRSAGSFLWLIFLAPVILLLLGAWIGGTSSKSFLRWLGVPLVFGALVPMAISSLVKYATMIALRVDPSHWSDGLGASGYSPEIHRVLVEKTAPLVDKLLAPVMSSVTWVAIYVLITGGVLVLLSFVATGKPAPAPRAD